LPKALSENRALRSELEACQNELYIIKWYLEVMEGGTDTREVVKEFATLRKKHLKLKQVTSARIKQLEKDLAHTEKERASAVR